MEFPEFCSLKSSLCSIHSESLQLSSLVKKPIGNIQDQVVYKYKYKYINLNIPQVLIPSLQDHSQFRT